MSDADDFLLQVRETITIIRPMRSVFVRGVTAPLSQAPSTSIRMHQSDIELIDDASDLLRMTRSEFIKWCARNCARDIIEQKKEFDRRNV